MLLLPLPTAGILRVRAMQYTFCAERRAIHSRLKLSETVASATRCIDGAHQFPHAQVELARFERQQARKGATLPQAEALLLAAQQADSIYSTAFQELALKVTRQLFAPTMSHPAM